MKPISTALRLALIIVMIGLLTACGDFPNRITPTATDGPSPTPTEIGATVEPVGSAVPTEPATAIPTATADSNASPTPIVDIGRIDIPPEILNLFTNGDFDFAANCPERTWPGVLVYPHAVAPGWTPVFGAFGFLGYQDTFPAGRIGSGNEVGTVQGRPEYKCANEVEDASRVTLPNPIDGKTEYAQQAFLAGRVGDQGVFQTVTTKPGDVCEVSFFAQSWSAAGDQGAVGYDPQTGAVEYALYGSDQLTQDQRDNSLMKIVIDLNGGNDPYRPGVLIYRHEELLSDGKMHPIPTYDAYYQIKYRFRPTGTRTTVFLINYRLWRFGHNDAYFDKASVQCVTPGADYPPATAVPTATAIPVPTLPNAEADKHVTVFGSGRVFQAYESTGVYVDHSLNALRIRPLTCANPPNCATVTVYAQWEGEAYSVPNPVPGRPTRDYWLCTDPNLHWERNPEFPTVLILACGSVESGQGWIPYALNKDWVGFLYQ